MANPIIKINGHPYPAPAHGLGFHISTIVNAARNGNGVVVGQVVGRDQQKLEKLVWPHLDAETWSRILQEFDNQSNRFYVTVTYPDMVHNSWTTRKMYPSDRTAEPLFLDEATGLPRDYINCSVNLIDCGEE